VKGARDFREGASVVRNTAQHRFDSLPIMAAQMCLLDGRENFQTMKY